MPYLIFSFFYMIATVGYLFFRVTLYRSYAIANGSNPDTVDIYVIFLKLDLPFFLTRLIILIVASVAIALYRKTSIDIAYALITCFGLFFVGDLVSVTVYRMLS